MVKEEVREVGQGQIPKGPGCPQRRGLYSERDKKLLRDFKQENHLGKLNSTICIEH